MSYDPTFDYTAPSIRSVAVYDSKLSIRFYGSDRYINYEFQIAEFNPNGNRIKKDGWLPIAEKESWGKTYPGSYTGGGDSVTVPGVLVPIRQRKFFKVRVRAIDTGLLGQTVAMTDWVECGAAVQWVL